jgi:hypothetical protein
MSTQQDQPSPETDAALTESRAMVQSAQINIPALQRLLKESLGDAVTNVTPQRVKWYERH